jgi:hypothetical protein
MQNQKSKTPASKPTPSERDAKISATLGKLFLPPKKA